MFTKQKILHAVCDNLDTLSVSYRSSDENWSFGNTEKVSPISSLSKQFTAASILALESDISNRSILQFFPNLKVDGDVTVLDLLNQSSGISEYLYKPREDELNSWDVADCCEFIESLSHERSGEFKYSNSNYVLLARIVELVTGKKFSEYIGESIFTPLKMDASYILPESDGTFHGWGDADIWSCVTDLESWYTSKLFDDYKGRLFEIANAIDSQYPYIAGLFRGIPSSQFYHSGSKPGFASFSAGSFDGLSQLIVLVNTEPSERFFPSLHQALNLPC